MTAVDVVVVFGDDGSGWCRLFVDAAVEADVGVGGDCGGGRFREQFLPFLPGATTLPISHLPLPNSEDHFTILAILLYR